MIYASARDFFSHLAFSVGTDIIRHVVLFFLLFQADLIRRFLFDGSDIWRFSPGASRLSLRHARAPISLAARPPKMPPRPRGAQCGCSAMRSVFYVNYAGCHPACGFLICCLGGCAPLPRAAVEFFCPFSCVSRKNVVPLHPQRF